MVTANLYVQGERRLKLGDVVWTSDTIKCALVEDSYSPNLTSHETWGDVESHEASGTGYTARGEEFSGKSISVSGSDVRRSGDDIEWDESSITARYGVVYKDTGTDSTSYLIAVVDFEEDRTSEDGLFAIRWPDNHVVVTSVNPA